MPRGPLADDWLYWDPETIFAYPHSREPGPLPPDGEEAPREYPEPRQLELFSVYPEGV
jgi:hypothetical protein